MQTLADSDRTGVGAWPDGPRRPAPRRPVRALAGSLAALALLVGCGTSDSTPDPDTADEPQVVELEVGGQSAVAVVPPGDSPTGLVLYVHGHGETHDSLTEGSDQKRVTDRLVADGYVVAASDAHFDAWGNQASQDDYVALAAELKSRYDTPQTFLLAESMGGVAALQILAGDLIPDLAGLAGISMLVDPTVAADTQYGEELRAAYGGQLPTGTQNPLEIPAEQFAGDPIRLYIAPEDSTVVYAENAEPFLAKLQGIADISAVSCQGGHIDPSCFQPDDLADWFAANALASGSGN
ncbi:alpha/beta hydrolase [Modestobacter excelsi]|uniref:alpha/beta hydrolase n=1 Tax=Modestobacter excelsi TaxID=2213161 RepID=UPI00110D20DB|nr:alpha/beta hydrolase [Modestobacter excelsi]